MSLILMSEHSKSICEVRITRKKINRFNNPRQKDGVEYCSCRKTNGVESGER